MKKIILPVLVLATLNAYAGEKGNGGESVNIDGFPRLRDLVENTNCSWYGGEEIMESNPLVDEVLKNVSQVDWYFAEDLKQEIQSLDFCLTSRLVKINTNDFGSIVTTYTHNASQAAIRLNRQVYIDTDITKSMPNYDKAFLIIHEAMHSYIPQQVYMRNQKVRSQVKAIEAVYKGEIATTASFHRQMMNNELDFPLSVNALTPVKTNILYIMGNYDVKRSIIMELASVSEFFKKMERINVLDLAYWHQNLLTVSTLDQLIRVAIDHKDVELLKKLVASENQVSEYTLSSLYGSKLAQENREINQLLNSQETIDKLVHSLFSDLQTKVVSVNEEGRISVTGMELLASKDSSKQAFTELSALTNLSETHPKLRVFMMILKKAINENNLSIQKNILNEEFYASLNKSVKRDIAKLEVDFELEKTVAIRKVDTLIDGFWIVLKTNVVQESGSKKWKDFLKNIDMKKLGYEIK